MRDAAGRSHNNSHASTPVLPGTYHKRRPHCPFATLYLQAHTRPRQRGMMHTCVPGQWDGAFRPINRLTISRSSP
ncbi:MAG TPA: hypothetical protein VGE05_14575, partial [Novosphingobium sp.]